MNLVDKLRQIAKTEGISLDEDRVNEVNEIINKHQEHSHGYLIGGVYDSKDTLLELHVQQFDRYLEVRETHSEKRFLLVYKRE